MIEQVEIRTEFGKTLVLPMRDSSNGLYIMELDGLDPTKSNIVTTSFARRDGTQRQASRRESRFPKIKLGFDPNFSSQTVESIRQELFHIFMTKTQVELRYTTESGLVVNINGEVESFDSPRMTQEPDATISFYCFDPDFRGLMPKIVEDTTVNDNSVGLLDYAGTVDTGFLFKLMPDRPVVGVSIENTTDNGITRTLEYNGGMLAGDILEISTISGAKGAWHTRGPARVSVLQGVSSFSDWVSIFQGTNRLNVFAEGAPVPYSIEYSEKYGGI